MTRRYVLIFVSAIFLLTSASTTVFSQDKPLTPGGAWGDHTGYTLFTPMQSNQVFLIDSQGRIVHRWTTSTIGSNAILRENGNLLVTTGQVDTKPQAFTVGKSGFATQITGRFEEYTWEGELLWAYEPDQPNFQPHHGIKIMPNGNILFIAWNYISTEDGLAIGRDPAMMDDGFWADSIFEYSPELNDIVWEWHVKDHLIQDFDSTKDNYGVVADNPQMIDVNYIASPNVGHSLEDWLHTNAVDYNAELDQIAISPRHFNELWIIDHSISTEEASGPAGDLIYRWGNPEAYDRGTLADLQLGLQHDVRWIPEGYPGAGNITVFSNQHLDDPDATADDIVHHADHSKVVEITPPLLPDGTYELADGQPYGPAEPTWVYGDDLPDEQFHSAALSSARRLINGNTFVTMGVPGIMFEVTPDDEVVWRYEAPFNQNAFLLPESPTSARQVSIFRALRYEPDYPAFEGRDLSEGVFPAEIATTDVNTPGLLQTGYGHETTLSSEFPVRYYAAQITQQEVNATASYHFEVEVLDGNITPVITVTDAAANVLAEGVLSDEGRVALTEDITLSDAGWLYITVSHAGDDLTDVAGTFRVTRKVAGPFADVAPDIPQIVYGTTIQDFISEDDTESLFAFYGEAGDQVTLQMQRDNGSLDPVVELVNADFEVLISAAAETELPVARIEAYTLPESGVYYIRTTRYAGNERPSDTTGVYTVELHLEDAAP